MASLRLHTLLNCIAPCAGSKLNFSTSSLCHNAYRRRLGLEPNPNAYGPLRNLPDFSFVDGRPVPLGAKKMVNLERQKNFCRQIVELSNEIDDGLIEYNKGLERKKEEVENILKKKLKPKGQLLETRRGRRGMK